MLPANKRTTLLGSARQLIADEGLTVSMLAAVIAAAVLAFGFGATADVIIAMLAIGAVTAVAETRLHRRG
ncbi:MULTISPECIES: hypothetical protein [unclassified Bradyrhizobium]|uniref:hypothetical protein n=1 Tax=unclassified Bradyrhizobium TaxID=2631580 RepID=UPI0020B3D241|nr:MULTISPECIES: hypothetical protein [unclassified Bradyrhizobium]MCP3399687.1 hypothetical protein [Bradyrhizobium sp. CCGB20]MCP3408325.1 hypothetical protein [Bradyrhizobium sp. CCGB01]